MWWLSIGQLQLNFTVAITNFNGLFHFSASTPMRWPHTALIYILAHIYLLAHLYSSFNFGLKTLMPTYIKPYVNISNFFLRPNDEDSFAEAFLLHGAHTTEALPRSINSNSMWYRSERQLSICSQRPMGKSIVEACPLDNIMHVKLSLTVDLNQLIIWTWKTLGISFELHRV